MAFRYSSVRNLMHLALILLLAAGNLSATDVWDQASPTDDTPGNTRNVLIPGDPAQRHDVEAKAGPTAERLVPPGSRGGPFLRSARGRASGRLLRSLGPQFPGVAIRRDD